MILVKNKIGVGKSNERKMSVPYLMRFFASKFFERTGIKYPLTNENWAVVGADLKRYVLDQFILREMEIDDVETFICWAFENKPREKWSPSMLRYFFSDWVRARACESEKSESLSDPPKDIYERRMVEKQLAEYFGGGFFDDSLTKKQYMIGLMWRRKNMTEEQIGAIIQRQSKKYTSEVYIRLLGWRNDLEALLSKGLFDARKEFYRELACREAKSIGDTLRSFHRSDLSEIFTDEELIQVPSFSDCY